MQRTRPASRARTSPTESQGKDAREGGISQRFLPVYDVDDLLAEGQLLDISDTGMRVSGIEASEGEEKKLMIEVNYEADVYSLYVTAICRWTKPEPDGSLVAGFEVTAWPPVADEVLDLITQSLALCDEEDPGVR